MIKKLASSTRRKARMVESFWRAGKTARRYIRHQAARRKAQRLKSEDNTVLASLCAISSVIHCYAELLPKFARHLDASIETFQFQKTGAPDPRVLAFYDAFGAKFALQVSQKTSLRKKAASRAAEIFSKLRSKSDVTRIREDGILLGDLIYDSYLRDLFLATVDIKDQRLLGYIQDALLFLYSSEEYFDTHRVKAVFVDHLVYIWQGALQRLAMQREVPVYTIYFDPRPSAQRVDLAAREDGVEIPVRFNYWLYPQVFSRMSENDRIVAAKKGRAFLEHRVSGGLQNHILPGQSAYAKASGTRALGTSTDPKLLILLHDFCDAVHGYRSLLFDDFYEWTHFLLREASQTPFEWYVKPHPNLNDYRRRGMKNSNQKVIEELKLAYPKIRFLEPSVSNKQLIDEGLAGVFTMYGTAAHEFPFLGVPAVCGADNPHVAYPFAETPETVEEYTRLIHAAGSLGSVKGADRIPEFCYMHFLHANEHLGAATTIFDPMPAPDLSNDEVWESALRAASPETDHILDTYVQDLLKGKTPSCVI